MKLKSFVSCSVSSSAGRSITFVAYHLVRRRQFRSSSEGLSFVFRWQTSAGASEAQAMATMAPLLSTSEESEAWSDGRGQGGPKRVASKNPGAALLPHLIVVPERSSSGRIRSPGAPHLPQTRVALVVVCSGQPALLLSAVEPGGCNFQAGFCFEIAVAFHKSFHSSRSHFQAYFESELKAPLIVLQLSVVVSSLWILTI